MSQGSFNSMWGGDSDLGDSIRHEISGDLFDDVNNDHEAVGLTIEDVIKDSDNILDIKDNTDIEAGMLKPRPLSCHCGEVMNGFGEGAHCPSGHMFLDKSIHNLGAPKNHMPVVFAGAFRGKELSVRHFSEKNKIKSDGKVILNTVKEQGDKLIISVSIQMRGKSKPWTHKGRRLGPDGKRDGEMVYTEKMTKGAKIVKDIRIHLSIGDTGYNISEIFSGKVRNKHQYTQFGDGWHLGEEENKTFDKASIKNICKESIDVYKEYMVD